MWHHKPPEDVSPSARSVVAVYTMEYPAAAFLKQRYQVQDTDELAILQRMPDGLTYRVTQKKTYRVTARHSARADFMKTLKAPEYLQSLELFRVTHKDVLFQYLEAEKEKTRQFNLTNALPYEFELWRLQRVKRHAMLEDDVAKISCLTDQVQVEVSDQYSPFYENCMRWTIYNTKGVMLRTGVVMCYDNTKRRLMLEKLFQYGHQLESDIINEKALTYKKKFETEGGIQ